MSGPSGRFRFLKDKNYITGMMTMTAQESKNHTSATKFRDYASSSNKFF